MGNDKVGAQLFYIQFKLYIISVTVITARDHPPVISQR